MYPSRLLGLLLTASLFACQPPATENTDSAVETDSAKTQDNQIVIGSIDTIDSAILGEERDLWVYLPRSAENENNDQVYPVVYLLDGNGHFRSVTGMIYQLSTTNGNMTVPEMIVVGIPNTDRMRDLTPTHTEGTSGGGTAFLDFIENEVIPHVEKNYPASQYRTFIGHSLGGLMAIEALITRPEVFNNYVAIDPSLWWDDQSVLRRAEAALKERDFTGKSLFVSVANTMRPGITYETVRDDTNEQTTHIRSILQFAEAAENDTSSGLNFAWKYYDDDSHGSVPLISEYDAFRFLFPWHDPNRRLMSFVNPDVPDDANAIAGFINDHFYTLSQNFGYPVVPPMNWVNRIARTMRFNDRPNSALAVSQLNLSNYPASPVTHEAMGDYYIWQSDEESARIHYQHALDRGADFDLEEKLNPPEEDQ